MCRMPGRGAAIDENVEVIRGFNRFYTRHLGVLRDGYLRTPYSLTEARVLFELAQTKSCEVGALRRAIGVDAGYLSRILGRFEADGLVARTRSDADRRRQIARLTKQGRAAFGVLDGRSAVDARALLDRLGVGEQQRLLGAMHAIRDVLESPDRSAGVTLRPPRPGDLGWVIERHGALYAAEYGWNDDFEALVARIVADHLAERDPERDACWIGEADGRRAGCVFCVRKDDRVAQLRLLLVEPWARGLGLGRRLVDQCIGFAQRAGYAELTLWTNDVLVAARRIYERAGFELVEETPHHSFGHDLVGQTWSLDLSEPTV
jgi:DNA-binding MarR family transcriptional regulator/N-acetylglutamate synthase-like GNAT family acetyltransferase